MRITKMSFNECADLLFDLTEKTSDYWDDKAAVEYRELMKRFKKEIGDILGAENEKH